MTPAERVNIQKGKEIPSRLKVNINNENDEIDNYIITHTQIREEKEQKQLENEAQKIVEQQIKKLFE